MSGANAVSGVRMRRATAILFAAPSILSMANASASGQSSR
jgi:hypothetical protein